jgi:predicted transcriptional regulator
MATQTADYKFESQEDDHFLDCEFGASLRALMNERKIGMHEVCRITGIAQSRLHEILRPTEDSKGITRAECVSISKAIGHEAATLYSLALGEISDGSS